jgi:hypothetical protein
LIRFGERNVHLPDVLLERWLIAWFLKLGKTMEESSSLPEDREGRTLNWNEREEEEEKK